MLETMQYTREQLLRERREGAVRALIRALGYAWDAGRAPQDLAQFIVDSYTESGEFERRLQADGHGNLAAQLHRHLLTRFGWCDGVTVKPIEGGYMVESDSILTGQESVLSAHGVARLDVEACMELVGQLTGQVLGFEFSYTVGDEKDWAMIRAPGSHAVPDEPEVAWLDEEALVNHRRLGVASGIVMSIGFARICGAEPEELGHYFYKVWDNSGHYEKLREKWGYGNALAYALSLAQARQVLYCNTNMVEDLDGYTIASPGWGTEIPQVMGTFGVLLDDVYRYFEGGGIPACGRLGLQYADRSDDRTHRVWLRAR